MQPLICHHLLKPGIKGTRAQLKMLIILQRMRTGFRGFTPYGFLDINYKLPSKLLPIQ